MANETDKHPLTPSEERIEQLILRSDPDIFKELPEERRKKLVHSLAAQIDINIEQSISQSFSGPLPPPEVLEQYKSIDPELASSIVKMAIDEQNYAHKRDEKIIDESFSVKKRGQYFALFIALFAISGGVTCILFGFEISGSIVSGVGLSSLVSEFIGRKKEPPIKNS
jgi:uncharacterized membrane protein